jgi:hypothetical protein
LHTNAPSPSPPPNPLTSLSSLHFAWVIEKRKEKRENLGNRKEKEKREKGEKIIVHSGHFVLQATQNGYSRTPIDPIDVI